jgi:hypothetical protein
MLRPWVTVRDLSGGIEHVLLAVSKTLGMSIPVCPVE